MLFHFQTDQVWAIYETSLQVATLNLFPVPNELYYKQMLLLFISHNCQVVAGKAMDMIGLFEDLFLWNLSEYTMSMVRNII